MLYNSSEQGSMPTWIVVVVLLVALFGFSDATYIAIEHFRGEIPPCTILNGCETVLTSKYSSVGPIRLEWLGVAYYLAFVVGVIAYLDSRRNFFLLWIARLSWIGIITSAILISLQVFVIKSFCLYCVMSAITSTVLFVLGMIILKKLRQTHDTNH